MGFGLSKAITLRGDTTRHDGYGSKYGLYLGLTKFFGAAMKLSESVKPISFLKSHTAEALRSVAEHRRPMVITQHGEAKAVLQDIVDYEMTQESLALLKILAQGSKSLEDGHSKPVKKSFSDIRKRVKAAKG
jgi:prevent-host-death family protein